MAKAIFVAGTDTCVGKTTASVALLQKARELGLSTCALKPLAAGCEETAAGWRNDDALALQAAATLALSYDEVNPIALPAAAAPHIAATEVGSRLSVARMVGFCQGSLLRRADFTLVEGAGGWLVPLNPRETLADLPKALELDVVLVVGMRLGALNHALLSAQAIQRDGLQLKGWIANRIDPQMDYYPENLGTLCSLLKAPLLGEIPYLGESLEDNWWRNVDLDLEPLGLIPASNG